MLNLYNNIELLCKKHNTNVTIMCKEIGISRASLSDLKMKRTSGLSAKTLMKIAEYFNVSIDYLIGRINKHTLIADRIKTLCLVHAITVQELCSELLLETDTIEQIERENIKVMSHETFTKIAERFYISYSFLVNGTASHFNEKIIFLVQCYNVSIIDIARETGIDIYRIKKLLCGNDSTQEERVKFSFLLEKLSGDYSWIGFFDENDYFESTDYLLRKTENPTTTNDSEVSDLQDAVTVEILNILSKLSPEGRDYAISKLRSLVELEEKKDK